MLRRRRHDRAGFALYAAVVQAARRPYFYAVLGVPDTLDGRFDLVGLHAALLIRRLRLAAEPGPTLAQTVFDAMFSEMDVALRELGVGDMSVGKKVKAMWDAFHGRAVAYEAALATADAAMLAEALARNVWRGTAPDGIAVPDLTLEVAATRLAVHALAQNRHLAGQALDALARGDVAFLDPEA